MYNKPNPYHLEFTKFKIFTQKEATCSSVISFESINVQRIHVPYYRPKYHGRWIVKGATIRMERGYVRKSGYSSVDMSRGRIRLNRGMVPETMDI